MEIPQKPSQIDILPQQTHYDTRALSLLAFIVAEPVL